MIDRKSKSKIFLSRISLSNDVCHEWGGAQYCRSEGMCSGCRQTINPASMQLERFFSVSGDASLLCTAKSSSAKSWENCAMYSSWAFAASSEVLDAVPESDFDELIPFTSGRSLKLKGEPSKEKKREN
jgi:hypothetical protein